VLYVPLSIYLFAITQNWFLKILCLIPLYFLQAKSGVGGLKATLDEILNSLPDESKRSAEMQQAAEELSKEIASTISLSELKQTLVHIQPNIKFLLKTFTCYAKILEVVGQTVEG